MGFEAKFSGIHSDHFVHSVRKILSSLDLPIFQFDGRGATENCD
jgi:hypothetical protein